MGNITTVIELYTSKEALAAAYEAHDSSDPGAGRQRHLWLVAHEDAASQSVVHAQPQVLHVERDLQLVFVAECVASLGAVHSACGDQKLHVGALQHHAAVHAPITAKTHAALAHQLPRDNHLAPNVQLHTRSKTPHVVNIQ